MLLDDRKPYGGTANLEEFARFAKFATAAACKTPPRHRAYVSQHDFAATLVPRSDPHKPRGVSRRSRRTACSCCRGRCLWSCISDTGAGAPGNTCTACNPHEETAHQGSTSSCCQSNSSIRTYAVMETVFLLAEMDGEVVLCSVLMAWLASALWENRRATGGRAIQCSVFNAPQSTIELC